MLQLDSHDLVSSQQLSLPTEGYGSRSAVSDSSFFIGMFPLESILSGITGSPAPSCSPGVKKKIPRRSNNVVGVTRNGVCSATLKSSRRNSRRAVSFSSGNANLLNSSESHKTTTAFNYVLDRPCIAVARLLCVLRTTLVSLRLLSPFRFY